VDVLPQVAAEARSVPIDEISKDDRLGFVARTMIGLVFSPDASVKDVNDVLQSIDGRIVSSRKGTLMLSVRIADPGSLGRLDAIIDRVRRTAPPTLLHVEKDMVSGLTDEIQAQITGRPKN
jgi:hypothetical protein